jgi:hypothetical protein
MATHSIRHFPLHFHSRASPCAITFQLDSTNPMTYHESRMLVTTRAGKTCLLTPWSRVLLGKLTGLQLVKKFPAFYGTRRFITALTSARHWEDLHEEKNWRRQGGDHFRPYLLLFSTYALQPSRLIVRSGLDVATFATRRLHACHHARAPSGGRWNCGQ